MANDRVGGTTFNLTQEYSAQMLGVRRATVTNIALALAKDGLISYRRGTVLVKDRAGLEDASCECYAAVNIDCSVSWAIAPGKLKSPTRPSELAQERERTPDHRPFFERANHEDRLAAGCVNRSVGGCILAERGVVFRIQPEARVRKARNDRRAYARHMLPDRAGKR